MQVPTNEELPNHYQSLSTSSLWKDNDIYLIHLVCPDNRSLSKVHTIHETVYDVLIDSCNRLKLTDPSIFSLAVNENNEYKFISPKKKLVKVLLKEAIVTSKQAQELYLKNVLFDGNIKTCRLYLRIKLFHNDLNNIDSSCLYYYYQQVKLDLLKYQNWLNINDYNNIFHKNAAKSIFLNYGLSSVNYLNRNAIKIHLHMPKCEITEESPRIIASILEKMLSGSEEGKPSPDDKNDNLFHNKRKIYSLSIPGALADDAHYIDSNIMLSFLYDATKIPFYGMHFYDVILIDTAQSQNILSKVGIGPHGVLVFSTSDYTAWLYLMKLGLNEISKFTHSKDILGIHETSSRKSYNFRCINEKEAKYLFKHFTEIKQFHYTDEYYHNNRSKLNNDSGARSSIIQLSRFAAAVVMSPIIGKKMNSVHNA